MPAKPPISWEAIKIGSFAHRIFELGVKQNCKTEKEFIDIAKALQMQEEWSFIDLKDIVPLIKVFFERNKNKYNENSLTEKKLSARIENLFFHGIADRIDIRSDGLEIIDYKTGNSPIKPLYRNWQLGFYAIAAEKIGPVRKLTLEMLKKEEPIEYVIDKNGNAIDAHSKRMSFNIEEVKGQLAETANKIINAYKNGFSRCPADKACDFCDEWF